MTSAAYQADKRPCSSQRHLRRSFCSSLFLFFHSSFVYSSFRYYLFIFNFLYFFRLLLPSFLPSFQVFLFPCLLHFPLFLNTLLLSFYRCSLQHPSIRQFLCFLPSFLLSSVPCFSCRLIHHQSVLPVFRYRSQLERGSLDVSSDELFTPVISPSNLTANP